MIFLAESSLLTIYRLKIQLDVSVTVPDYCTRTEFRKFFTNKACIQDSYILDIEIITETLFNMVQRTSNYVITIYRPFNTAK